MRSESGQQQSSYGSLAPIALSELLPQPKHRFEVSEDLIMQKEDDIMRQEEELLQMEERL
jgi:hypothetical protein